MKRTLQIFVSPGDMTGGGGCVEGIMEAVIFPLISTKPARWQQCVRLQSANLGNVLQAVVMPLQGEWLFSQFSILSSHNRWWWCWFIPFQGFYFQFRSVTEFPVGPKWPSNCFWSLHPITSKSHFIPPVSCSTPYITGSHNISSELLQTILSGPALTLYLFCT